MLLKAHLQRYAEKEISDHFVDDVRFEYNDVRPTFLS
uniref:Transposase n=1 Tax=Ascaris lumbricoides TaxID=6252 RepID=A0A0M3IH72_ASCLU